VGLFLLSSAPPAPAAPAGTPRLELRAAASRLEIPRYGPGPVWLDLGISLAALDAPSELQVRGATYDDPIRVWQAFHRPGGVQLAELPSGILEDWIGLDRFLRIDLYQEGTLVRSRLTDACPSGYQSERVDGSGPFDATYPTGCGFNPLTLGAVWGIDEGWSSQSLLWNANVRLPNGRYIAKVSITSRYRTLFDIAPEDAAVRIAIRIRKRSGCDFGGAPAAPVGTAFRRALTPAPITAAPDPATVPDPVALPAYGIVTSHERGRDYLQFGADVWNRGPASLLVEGFRAPTRIGWMRTSTSRRTASSWGRRPSARSISIIETSTSTGTSRSSLATVSSTPRTPRSEAGSRRSVWHPRTRSISPSTGAVWRPEHMGFSQCGSATSTWIREILPTGWGDTYFQGVPGQSFDITDLSNGNYWIEVRANPGGRLFDGDPTNDVELREVILRGRLGSRTVETPPWHGIDTEGFFGFGR
jgi:hypothetical protein